VRILQKSQENGQNWTNTNTGTDRVLGDVDLGETLDRLKGLLELP
ncbi:hypothetical protein Tco_0155336, partial [Tanacetum coccineum]